MTIIVKLSHAERKELKEIYTGSKKPSESSLTDLLQSLKFISSDELTPKGKKWIKDTSSSLFGSYKETEDRTYFFSKKYMNSN